MSRAALVLKVPIDYSTIQDAVDHADPGDTIFVADGTYNECVTLYKDDLSLLGENPGITIVDSNFINEPIYVSYASNIYISGLTVCDGGICGIYLDHANNVSLVGNIVANNTIRGIEFIDSENSVVKENTIVNNGQGILLSDSNGILYHNNFVNNNQQTYSDTTNAWDIGYPSGGNYWSDYTGTDLYSGPYQNETGSDGIGDTPYSIDNNNADNYPLMNPYAGHDISILSVVSPKTIIGQGYGCNITVSIANHGTYNETFDLALRANTTPAWTDSIFMESGSTTIATLPWSTAGFPMGNYTLSAYASPVPGETDRADNNLIDGMVYVGIPGDVNGDHKVNIIDILIVAKMYGQNTNDPHYNANTDINNDGKTNVIDILITAKNFGKTNPY
jgi:parallel beta-helix repeat protein